MSKSRITGADEVYVGDVYYGKYQALTGKSGLRMTQLFTHQFGAVATADPDGACTGAGATGGSVVSIAMSTGAALYANGRAEFDVPRSVGITSTSDESGDTFTVIGTDYYGEQTTENVTGPNATTTYTNKAFSTVSAVTVSTAITTTQLTIGTGTKLGFPVRVADKGKVVAFTADGLADASATIVVGLTATGASTATTADVRGTVTPNSAPNSSIRFTAAVIPDGNKTKINVFGAAQA